MNDIWEWEWQATTEIATYRLYRPRRCFRKKLCVSLLILQPFIWLYRHSSDCTHSPNLPYFEGMIVQPFIWLYSQSADCTAGKKALPTLSHSWGELVIWSSSRNIYIYTVDWLSWTIELDIKIVQCKNIYIWEDSSWWLF